MRSWIRRVASVVVAVSAGATVFPQEPASNESLDRLRAKLEKPPSKLTLEQRTPDFRVHIEKRPPMQDIFDVPPWATDPVGWQPPPGFGFDLLSVYRSVAKSVAQAKRDHDERGAREDVQRAIADFCAAQPAATDGQPSAAAQTCSTSAAIR